MSFEPLSVDPRKYNVDYEARPDISKVGEFSLDENRTHLVNKRASARYLIRGYDHNRILESPLNLRDGYATWVPNQRGEKLKQIQQWIIDEAKKGESLRKAVNADIVTSRGILVSVGISPYDLEGEGIKLVCRKYQDVIFIQDFDTDKKMERESNQSFEDRLAEYTGRKFQKSVSSAEPDGMYDPSESVNDNVEFYAVFNANIGGLGVLYRGQVNCLTPDGKEYLEAKTQVFRLGYGRYFPKKALKWWMQSRLTTVDKMVVGIRERIGIVNKVYYMDVDRVLEYCPNWDVNVCFAVLETFLRTVQDIMQNLTEEEVLVVERQPGNYEFNFNVLDENDPSLEKYDIIEEDLKNRFE
ncbi:RAI1 like PD-(D/E)XK nuclease domain-containing protein [Ditylenchus destructor]|nr:RAI1 like PD-(D/E)XK nuclease domain-containing protein [Ditylenchus destructor]